MGQPYRFTKPKGPTGYKTAVKCPRCKLTECYNYEEIRSRWVAKQARCYCAGVPHPHKPASHKLCRTYPHPMPMPPELELELQEMQERLLGNTRRTADR